MFRIQKNSLIYFLIICFCMLMAASGCLSNVLVSGPDVVGKWEEYPFTNTHTIEFFNDHTFIYTNHGKYSANIPVYGTWTPIDDNRIKLEAEGGGLTVATTASLEDDVLRLQDTSKVRNFIKEQQEGVYLIPESLR